MLACQCQSLPDMALRPRLSQGECTMFLCREGATANKVNSTPTRRARSSSAPNKASPQQYQRRPPVGSRQASIGIRRMPSSNTLRQVAQQPNPSAQRLSTPLPALDEEHALGQAPSNSSKPESSSNKVEPSRLRKVRSAIQTRIPIWGTPEKQKPMAANGVAAHQDEEPADYTSGMVDVLDTLGMCSPHFPSTATLANNDQIPRSLLSRP